MYRLISMDRTGNEFGVTSTLTACIRQAVSVYNRLGMTSMILRWDGSNVVARGKRIRLP